MRLPRLGLLPRVVLGLAAVALLPLAIAPFIIDLNRDAMTSQVLRTHAVAARSAAARVEAAIASVRGPAEALARNPLTGSDPRGAGVRSLLAGVLQAQPQLAGVAVVIGPGGGGHPRAEPLARRPRRAGAGGGQGRADRVRDDRRGRGAAVRGPRGRPAGPARARGGRGLRARHRDVAGGARAGGGPPLVRRARQRRRRLAHRGRPRVLPEGAGRRRRRRAHVRVRTRRGGPGARCLRAGAGHRRRLGPRVVRAVAPAGGRGGVGRARRAPPALPGGGGRAVPGGRDLGARLALPGAPAARDGTRPAAPGRLQLRRRPARDGDRGAARRAVDAGAPDQGPRGHRRRLRRALPGGELRGRGRHGQRLPRLGPEAPAPGRAEDHPAGRRGEGVARERVAAAARGGDRRALLASEHRGRLRRRGRAARRLHRARVRGRHQPPALPAVARAHPAAGHDHGPRRRARPGRRPRPRRRAPRREAGQRAARPRRRHQGDGFRHRGPAVHRGERPRASSARRATCRPRC